MTGSSSDKAGKKERVAEGTSALEWAAAAVGAILFVTMIGYMAFVGAAEGNGAPAIEFSSSTAVLSSDRHLVRFQATNIGDRTVAGLVVKATLSDGQGEVESAEVTIDYLPTGSSRTGGVFFSRDPRGLELEFAPVSYVDP